MCDFCKNIYKTDVYVSEVSDYISKDSDGKYWIHANTGDKYYQGMLFDINYCPMCGKDLRSVQNGKD